MTKKAQKAHLKNCAKFVLCLLTNCYSEIVPILDTKKPAFMRVNLLGFGFIL